MSHHTRPKARGPVPRPRRQHRIESLLTLEERLVMAPVVASTFRTAVFTAATTPTNDFLGTVAINTTPLTNGPSPVTSVSQFASNSQFGGDIVKIEAGPGGEFGKGLYAISRGAGSNANALNKPGVLYRLDPATGKSSVFFDLNTVVNQLEPGATAANSLGNSTGLVNWYDLAFDNEGYFDGKPSLFISTSDRTDPTKNTIYRVAPDGSFLGAFVNFTAGSAAQQFTVTPTSILVPPPEQQTFLRGLLVGNGTPNSTTQPSITSSDFTSLFFDANAFRPGQDLSTASLPAGVTRTPLNFGPQVALTAANVNYNSPAYSAFTDFGTPGIPYDPAEGTGGIQGAPGLSGIQGLAGTGRVSSLVLNGFRGGELLISNSTTTGTLTQNLFNIFDINGGLTPAQITTLTTQATATAPSGVDTATAVSTPFRRFEDVAFDQYGYFSSSAPLAGLGGTTGTTTTGDTLPYAGSLFVSDLATGLAVQVTSIDIPAVPNVSPDIPATPVAIPIQGPGAIGIQLLPDGTFGPIVDDGNSTGGSNLGGRIIRIDPNGRATEFATNFNTSRFQSSQSFLDSSLSITFSADGTTLYAADNDGIWQFKTVTSLAGSTSGSIVGLNDLRTLGVPYDGQNSAVAVIDTGVDDNPSFRGRVANGQNVLFNGSGNQDTAPGSTATDGTTTGFADGHGTLLAGVVAQFVPQATIQPINVFSPIGTTSTATGATATTNVATSPEALYNGLKYSADNPFVADPVRFNKQDRVVAATLGFGTTQTFDTEVSAQKKFAQVTLALKNQLHRMRQVGVQPIAATGQFGSTTTATTGTTTTSTLGNLNGVSMPAVFNEVLSVTGSYPFPIQPDATSTPLNPFVGVIGRLAVPYLLGGTITTGGTTGTTNTGTIASLVANDATIFKDKLLSSANRNVTTDYAAPALDIPTFRRNVASTFTSTSSGAVGSQGTGLKNDPANLVFQQGGTSLAAAITTGSYAMVASALDYWAALTPTGATTDAYLTQPVGVRSLNFGPHTLKDLNAYANPDGINSILQWTAVPVQDDPATFNDAATTPSNGPKQLLHSTQNKVYSRISVGNAVAAIEGTIALDYLFRNNSFDIIDSNHNGLITAQEIQNFVDGAQASGLPEAGAMARLLGGTARIPGNSTTGANQQPDQPDALQRRFNFFDFAANGTLKGVIALDTLKQLSQKLLPQPGDFTVVDRQRSSAIRYLLDPSKARATQDLQWLKPRAVFIPASTVAKYRGFSPAKLGVGRNANPLQSGPAITLFGTPSAAKPGVKKPTTPVVVKPATTSATTTPTATPTATPTPTPTKPTGSGLNIAQPPVATAPGTSGAISGAGSTGGSATTPAQTSGVTYSPTAPAGKTDYNGPLATKPKPSGDLQPDQTVLAPTATTGDASAAQAATTPTAQPKTGLLGKAINSLNLPFLKSK